MRTVATRYADLIFLAAGPSLLSVWSGLDGAGAAEDVSTALGGSSLAAERFLSLAGKCGAGGAASSLRDAGAGRLVCVSPPEGVRVIAPATRPFCVVSPVPRVGGAGLLLLLLLVEACAAVGGEPDVTVAAEDAGGEAAPTGGEPSGTACFSLTALSFTHHR